MRSLILTQTCRGKSVPRRGRGEVDLAESAFADQSVEPVGAAALGAVHRQRN